MTNNLLNYCFSLLNNSSGIAKLQIELINDLIKLLLSLTGSGDSSKLNLIVSQPKQQFQVGKFTFRKQEQQWSNLILNQICTNSLTNVT